MNDGQMKSAAFLLKNPAASKSSGSTDNTSKPLSRAHLMAEVWAVLKLRGLVHDPVGSAIYNQFSRDLLDKSENEIRAGLDRSKDFTGYLSSPAFRELCQPDTEALGLPNPESAYSEACQAAYPVHTQRFTHAAVYQAGADTGSGKKQFMENYSKRTKEVMGGIVHEMPRHPALEKISAPLSKDEMHKRIAEMKQRLGM